MKKLPYFDQDAQGRSVLMVDGRPYLGLGGELKNSSSSDPQYLEQKVWPALRPLGLDTLLLPIAWETIEPEEGRFSFDVLEAIVQGARREGLRLVLLWFGLWKNGESHYVPMWVKRDARRFWLAQHAPGGKSYCISPLCEEAVAADARAFSRLMQHIKQLDGAEQTVLMVQVENEVGFLDSPRDYSDRANQAYAQDVPPELGAAFGLSGSWDAALGERGPEWFMAWHYARAIEQIAAAGKQEYPLPMFVNAWLEQHPHYPGAYPSGGPIARLMALWKLAAPSIDAMAPDIYVSDFAGVCKAYDQPGNPLILPEVRRDPVTASNVFYAFGHHRTVLFSPFGIDEFMDHTTFNPDRQLLEHINIDLSSFDCSGTADYLIQSYALISQAREYILANAGRMRGFIKTSNHDRGCVISTDSCDLIISYQQEAPGKPGSAGMLIEQDTNDFVLMGCRFTVEPKPKPNDQRRLVVLRMEEGEFRGDKWLTRRILNGDERYRAGCGDMASALRIIVDLI